MEQSKSLFCSRIDAVLMFRFLALLLLVSSAHAAIDATPISVDGRRVGYDIRSGADAVVGSGCDCDLNTYDYCEGTSLEVTATSTFSANPGTPVDSVYTWSFNDNTGNAYCGKFANGDWWLAPKTTSTVTVTGVTGSGGGTTVRVDANPSWTSYGLLTAYPGYDAGEVVSFPQDYTAVATSLMAGLQRDETLQTGAYACGTSGIIGSCLDSINVVTVLNFVPDGGGRRTLRPHVSGTSKTFYTLDDFDFTKVPDSALFTGTDAAGVATIQERWNHSTEIFALQDATGISSQRSEGGRAFRSHIMVDDYGAGMAQAWGTDLLKVFSSSTSSTNKQAALAALMVYGLDIYHTQQAETLHLVSGASQHSGRMLPIMIAADLLKSTSVKTNLTSYLSSVDETITGLGPLELNQVWSSANGPLWGDPRGAGTYLEKWYYWADLFGGQCFDGAAGMGGSCNPNVGNKAQKDPYALIDGPPPKPGTSYISSSLGSQNLVTGIACLMPGVKEILPNSNLITYTKRVASTGVSTDSDSCAPPDPRENLVTCVPWDARNAEDTAAAYQSASGCSYLGSTWGPDPNDTSTCITNNQSPNTGQNGRFGSIDGASITPSYTVSEIESNWTTLTGSCN